MKSHILYIGCALLLGLASCSSEDELGSSTDTITDCFAPDPNATDAESVLRRQFKQDEGSYLLFTDTLSNEYLGKDYNGDDRYKTELLDMGWNLRIGRYATIPTYTYEYLTDQAEKEAAVKYIKEYLLTHLPASLRPFSWFVVKSITADSDGTTYQALSGQRAVAIAMDGITEDNINDATTEILTTTLSKVLEGKTKELQEFYDVCEDLYYTYFGTDDNPTWDKEINLRNCMKAGFIVPYYFWGPYVYCGYYPKKEADMASFTDLIMNNSMDEIEEMYAEYPIVIQKAKILHDIFESIGYIF